jgi:regulatory protein
MRCRSQPWSRSKPPRVAPRRSLADLGDRLEHALEFAYRYLNRRERTVDEMRRHLAREGVEAATVDDAVRELLEAGYLDDARFARILAEDKRELEHWGQDRIARTLLARGIDRELIEQTLAADAPGGELSRALALLHRRFPSPPTDRRARDRALGVLLRKGFDSELALDALRAYARTEPDLL